MKPRLCLLAITLLCYTSLLAEKDTCLVGIYVNNLYDFKVDEKSFMADFWMWVNYRNDSLKFENAIEVTNSKSADFNHYTIEKKGTSDWAAQKCRAQLIHQWNVGRFPFDRQVLQITLEDSQYDTSALVYMADTINSKIDTAVNTPEWTIEKFSVQSFIRTYKTTYGNPWLAGKSAYPGILVQATMRRNDSWIKLVKMLTGVYVAFLISCIVFFISSENQDSRFGLCVGGVFAAIGNKYIVESIVPSSSGNTLMDNVHTITFIFIFLIIILVTISLRLFESGDERKKHLSKRLDRYAFFSLSALYAAINIVLVYLAAR